MLDIQQKRKVRSVMYHKGTLVLLFLVVLFAMHSTWLVYNKKKDSENMRNMSLKQVEELRLRSNELELRINKLATVTGVEEEIRSKFSVVKDGESMVVIVPDENMEVSTTSQKKTIWGIIKDLF